MGAFQPFIMAADLSKQVFAMDSLANLIIYEWRIAAEKNKVMSDMHRVWQDITKSIHYIGLADKRKECIHFFWHQTRNRILAENNIHGRWLDGKFYARWDELPEEYKYNDSLLKTLPAGHFWLDANKNPTGVRYFISSDCKGENKKHLPIG
jgi:hypothetical protein